MLNTYNIRMKRLENYRLPTWTQLSFTLSSTSALLHGHNCAMATASCGNAELTAVGLTRRRSSPASPPPPPHDAAPVRARRRASAAAPPPPPAAPCRAPHASLCSLLPPLPTCMSAAHRILGFRKESPRCTDVKAGHAAARRTAAQHLS